MSSNDWSVSLVVTVLPSGKICFRAEDDRDLGLTARDCRRVAEIGALARVVPVAQAGDQLPALREAPLVLQERGEGGRLLREGDVRIVAVEAAGELADVVAVDVHAEQARDHLVPARGPGIAELLRDLVEVGALEEVHAVVRRRVAALGVELVGGLVIRDRRQGARADVGDEADLGAEDLAVHVRRLGLGGLVGVAATARDDRVVLKARAGRAFEHVRIPRPVLADFVRVRELALEIVIRASRLVRVDSRLRLAVCLEVTDDQVDVGRIARLPGDAATQRIVVVAATVRHAGDDGLHPAVVLVGDNGEPALQLVSEWTRNSAFGDDLVEAAVGEVRVALEFLRGRVRDELDCPAGRVAAE